MVIKYELIVRVLDVEARIKLRLVLPFDGQISPLRCASVEMTEEGNSDSMGITIRWPEGGTATPSVELGAKHDGWG